MTNEEIDALWDRCREHKNNTVELVREIVRLAIAAEREACVQIINEHRIPVGNSAAGEMACEWTYSALKEIRDAIRARGEA